MPGSPDSICVWRSEARSMPWPEPSWVAYAWVIIRMSCSIVRTEKHLITYGGKIAYAYVTRPLRGYLRKLETRTSVESSFDRILVPAIVRSSYDQVKGRRLGFTINIASTPYTPYSIYWYDDHFRGDILLGITWGPQYQSTPCSPLPHFRTRRHCISRNKIAKGLRGSMRAHRTYWRDILTDLTTLVCITCLISTCIHQPISG